MRVKFYATFRELMGTKEVEVHGVRTVRELIDYLAEHYNKRIRDELLHTPRVGPDKPVDGMILVNGHNVFHLKGLDTELKDDDEVHIFPPAGGG